MTDYDFIKNKAYADVWCAPDQDRQYIFKPSRVSRRQGVTNSQAIMGDIFKLPLPGVRMHVYMLGSISISLLNLDNIVPNTWTKVDTFCNRQKMIVDIYTGNGLHFPRGDAWLMFTDSKAICLCISQVRLIDSNATDGIASDDLVTNPIYIRFYSNAFFTTTRATLPKSIDVYNKIIKVNSDIQTLNQFIQSKNDIGGSNANLGKVYGYVNGRCYPQIRQNDFAMGDYVELVYDSAIESVSTVALLGAPSFESKLDLDSKNKYLVNPQLNSTEIRYFDDLDFYLGKSYPDGSWRGCYVHRNAVSNIRMVTHDIYSVSDELLSALRVGVTPNWSDSLSKLEIKIVIRSSGFKRPLIKEHARIDEMYRLKSLTEQDVILKEPNISLDEWTMANLEASHYTLLMSTLYKDVTNINVARMYGYFGLSKVLGILNTNYAGTQTMVLPVAGINNSTIFEYDSNGRMRRYVTHASGANHLIDNTGGSVRLEVVTGVPGDATLAPGVNLLSHDHNYRFYRKASVSQWVDVTDTGVYQIIPGVNNDTLTWLVPGVFCVVSDQQYPLVDTTFPSGEPILNTAFTSRGDSLLAPLTDVEVWLNGYSLVEGIDYNVNWPDVVICTKSHWNALGVSNHVVFRARGLQSGNVRKSNHISGFVTYGMISYNDKIDYYKDKNVKVIFDGYSKDPDKIRYMEDGVTGAVGGFTPLFKSLGEYDQNSTNNGKPYCIREIYTSTKMFTEESTTSLRERSLDFDFRMRDWVTENVSVTLPTVPNMILNPYELFSPFLAAIIKALLNNEVPTIVYRKEFLDYDEVDNALNNWRGHLALDPTNDAIYNTLDHNVIAIHAHPYAETVTVDVYQYRLLEFIAEYFLKSRVDVSKFILVSATTTPPGQW